MKENVAIHDKYYAESDSFEERYGRKSCKSKIDSNKNDEAV